MKKASSLLVVGLIVLAACVSARADIPLLNAGFESPVADGTEPAPDNWGFFTSGPNSSGVTSNLAHSGGQSLLFYAPPEAGAAGSYQGYAQNISVSIATSDTVTFSGYFRADPGLPLADNAKIKIGIEFKRGDNSEISRVETEILPLQLSSSSWLLFSVSGSPLGEAAASATFTLVQVNGNSLPNSGIVYVDDVVAIPEPSSLLLVAGAIAGLGTLVRVRKTGVQS